MGEGEGNTELYGDGKRTCRSLVQRSCTSRRSQPTYTYCATWSRFGESSACTGGRAGGWTGTGNCWSTGDRCWSIHPLSSLPLRPDVSHSES